MSHSEVEVPDEETGHPRVSFPDKGPAGGPSHPRIKVLVPVKDTSDIWFRGTRVTYWPG